MRLFQILDEMNQADTKNNTRLVAVGNQFVAARKVKPGAIVEMGADETALHDLLTDKVIPILVLVDREEYFKREKQ